jgi:hypothetical protein
MHYQIMKPLSVIVLLIVAALGEARAQTTAPSQSTLDLQRRVAELEAENRQLRAGEKAAPTVETPPATTRSAAASTQPFSASAALTLREFQATCRAYVEARIALGKAHARAEDEGVIFRLARDYADNLEAVVRKAYELSKGANGARPPRVDDEHILICAQLIAGDAERRDKILAELEVQRRASNQLRRGEIPISIYNLQTMMFSFYEGLINQLTTDVITGPAKR